MALDESLPTDQSGFQMNDCQKTYNKVVTSTNHNSRKQRDEPQIIRNFFKAREKSHVQAALGFGFTFHWLKKQARQ